MSQRGMLRHKQGKALSSDCGSGLTGHGLLHTAARLSKRNSPQVEDESNERSLAGSCQLASCSQAEIDRAVRAMSRRSRAATCRTTIAVRLLDSLGVTTLLPDRASCKRGLTPKYEGEVATRRVQRRENRSSRVWQGSTVAASQFGDSGAPPLGNDFLRIDTLARSDRDQTVKTYGQWLAAHRASRRPKALCRLPSCKYQVGRGSANQTSSRSDGRS